MASMAHRRGGPGSSVHYAAAKGAVVSMTLGVAREFAQAGIRCLSISPGPVRTPFQSAAQTSPELVQRFLDDVPMKRFGEAGEIGEWVLVMCWAAGAFMPGDRVLVRGGGGGRWGAGCGRPRRRSVISSLPPRAATPNAAAPRRRPRGAQARYVRGHCGSGRR